MAFLNDRDWLLAHVRYSKDDGGKTTEMMECFRDARTRSEKVLNILAPGNSADDAELRRKWPELKKIPTVVECVEMFCQSLMRYACEVLPYQSHLVAMKERKTQLQQEQKLNQQQQLLQEQQLQQLQQPAVEQPDLNVTSSEEFAESPECQNVSPLPDAPSCQEEKEELTIPSQQEAVDCMRRVLGLAEMLGDSGLICRTIVQLADWHETRIAKWHGDSTIADPKEAKRLRVHLSMVQQQLGSRVESECPICLETLEEETDEVAGVSDSWANAVGGGATGATASGASAPGSTNTVHDLSSGHRLGDLATEGNCDVLMTTLKKTPGVFVLGDCFHRFHVYCLDKYHLELAKKNALMLKCPLCRSTL